MSTAPSPAVRAETDRQRALPNVIFATRWLQLPLYLGLIVAQCVYVLQFWVQRLKTFINAANYSEKVLLWQTLIHIAFLFSALAIALADRVMLPSRVGHDRQHGASP